MNQPRVSRDRRRVFAIGKTFRRRLQVIIEPRTLLSRRKTPKFDALGIVRDEFAELYPEWGELGYDMGRAMMQA